MVPPERCGCGCGSFAACVSRSSCFVGGHRSTGCRQSGGPIQAQVIYPHAPVDLVVPFPPGGVTDIAARAVADFLTARWAFPVVVSHVAGDGGATGTLRVLHSRPDGLTM